MQPRDFRAHLHPHLGVEVGQRLVEKKDLGIAHDGAAQSDALPLAAGERLRLSGRASLSRPSVFAVRLIGFVDEGSCLSCAIFKPKAMFSKMVMCG